MLRSIRWRLTLSYVILTMLTIGVVGVLSLYFIRNYAERQELDYLDAAAQNIVTQVRPLLGVRGRETRVLQDLVDAVGFLGNVTVTVRDSRENVLVVSSSDRQKTFWLSRALAFLGPPTAGSPNEELAPGSPISVVRRYESIIGPHFFFRSSDRYAERGVPGFSEIPVDAAPKSSQRLKISIGDDGSPMGFLELSNGPDFSTQLLKTARTAFLFAALGAVLVATFVGLIMGRGLTSPLVCLSKTASEMSEQNWSVRAPDCGNDEIGRLAVQFNLMAERLEASFRTVSQERDQLRRFIQDASHELRTPLTALSTFTELLSTQASEDTHAREEFLAESQVQIKKLGWIVHNLLDLTRLDAGLTTLNLAECPTAALVRSAVNTLRAKADEKGVRLVQQIGIHSPTILCDRDRMEIALRNLLDNAITFSAPKDTVEISATDEGCACLMSVRDSGPGIDAEDLPHIFERFYRSPKAVSQGSGLGLAIVKSIVEAHGGTVSARSEPGAGSELSVVLPLVGAY